MSSCKIMQRASEQSEATHVVANEVVASIRPELELAGDARFFSFPNAGLVRGFPLRIRQQAFQ